MKKLIGLISVSLMLLGIIAWESRPAYNNPKSVVVNAATTAVPTAFSSASGSLVLQNLVGQGYQNIKVINESKSPISFLTLPVVSAAPGLLSQRLHIASSGIETYNNISVFDNLYIQSEDNAIAEDKIKINVW